MFKNLFNALAAKCSRGNWAMLFIAFMVSSLVSLQACTPLGSNLPDKSSVQSATTVTVPKAGNPDENPKRRYDPNWKLTGYFNNADYAVINQQYEQLQKEEGDGNTIQCFNTDKDWQCKMGFCHDPGTEIVERPGWEDEARTVDNRKGPPHLNYAERKAWYRDVKARNGG
jgi:hypothetical protein